MKTDLEAKREVIMDYLNCEEDFVNAVYDILLTCQGTNQNSLLEYIGFTEEEIRKFDSAVPQPYADKIKEIYPKFNTLNHAYNYNTNKFGEMYNVVEAFGEAVIRKLQGIF